MYLGGGEAREARFVEVGDGVRLVGLRRAPGAFREL
jgi:hypothetical protein